MKLRLIGITGKAGSGKDTIGEYLDEMYCYRRISFAQPIRNGVSAMLELSSECFQHPLKEQVLVNIGRSPRQLLQTLGTEWGRNLVHPDLWLILAKESIERAWADGFGVAITDVRFENEASMVRELGGQVWHVMRDSAGTPHQHASEAGVLFHPNDDELVDNNGSLDDLYVSIDKIMEPK
jgi:hypothetical protein